MCLEYKPPYNRKHCLLGFLCMYNTHLVIYVVYSRFEPPKQQQELHGAIIKQPTPNSQTDNRHPTKFLSLLPCFIQQKELTNENTQLRLRITVFRSITRHLLLLTELLLAYKNMTVFGKTPHIV